jgi:hypothetical protein
MPWVGFEPTIPVFDRAKTDNALDRAATVIDFFHANIYIKFPETVVFVKLNVSVNFHSRMYFNGTLSLNAIVSISTPAAAVGHITIRITSSVTLLA